MKLFIKSSEDIRKWTRYRKPRGNWTDECYDHLEASGFNSVDFRANTMESLLEVADDFNIPYDIDDSYMNYGDVGTVIFYLDDEFALDFNQFLNDKNCVYWDRQDFLNNFSEVVVHFTK